MINRSVNLFIALFVIIVISIETYMYWFHRFQPWQPASPIGRMVFYYSFFTVLSNIMLAVSCAVLACKPTCDRTWFNVIRLNGIVGVMITMLVYNVMLRGIHKPPSLLLAFANESLHVVIPLLGLLTWLLYGPFMRINLKVVSYVFLSLLGYGLYIFIRGHLTGQYPYPFINVNRIGYEKSLMTAGMVAMLFFILVMLLAVIERIRIKLSHSAQYR
ncbi:hypothetical protein DES39_1026 [Orbus hercynius]|uniref:FAR-17a/AIG1-like protein n=1 Tax=Orbus hercynius TaxID=593135 RepID=A0A495RJR6_9GAMM|nr:Pr6Pr family membrane protein [Orbus hercynius]RKS87783.1 hypothetical protein DES39_1026 [Orbus hercynius]